MFLSFRDLDFSILLIFFLGGVGRRSRSQRRNFDKRYLYPPPASPPPKKNRRKKSLVFLTFSKMSKNIINIKPVTRG